MFKGNYRIYRGLDFEVINFVREEEFVIREGNRER